MGEEGVYVCACVCLCVNIFVCIHRFVGGDRYLCDIGYNNSPPWRSSGLFLQAAARHLPEGAWVVVCDVAAKDSVAIPH